MKKKMLIIVLKWGALLGVALSVLEMVKMYARNIDYSAGPVFDLISILLFIFFIYLGTKEFRNDVLGGCIRFPKAYGTGALITLVAFIIIFVYLMIHYTWIEKDGLAKVNQRHQDQYRELLLKTTIEETDLTRYVTETNNLVKKEGEQMLKESSSDAPCDSIINVQLQIILTAFGERIQKSKLIDSVNFKYDTFSTYAQKTLMNVEHNLVSNIRIGDDCVWLLNNIMLNSKTNMQLLNPIQWKYDRDQADIPHYSNAFPLTLLYSLSVLLYGLFFAIFVALYLCKRTVKELPEEGKNEEEDRGN